ncbi:unnamed protein product [Allacma fusca]|uniref:G-protein coupled receptors family 1 profile domain-containing protein n=1 Tax=Allacma fusca TaxID=39272 RepID=A0A8J2JUW1_9HEXA|nr:unnamed protein product [Allacma fusca]
MAIAEERSLLWSETDLSSIRASSFGGNSISGTRHDINNTTAAVTTELMQSVTESLIVGSSSGGRLFRNNFTIATLTTDDFGLMDDFNDSSRNFSVGQLEPQFPLYIRTTSTLLCAVILFIGVVGNILVPIVVWRNKDLRSSTNIFLVNLSVADLLVLVVCMPTSLVELHTEPEVWILGATMCKLVPFAELSVAHASVLTILAISLERYIAICRPLRANYTCTKQRAVGICIAIWIIAVIATSPVLIITEHKQMLYQDQTMKSVCLTATQDFWPTAYFLASISFFFFIPLFILISLYWVISRNLMSDPCTSATPRCCGSDHPNMRARKQVVIMLATVVFFFFICLLPFRIFSLYIILAPATSTKNMGQELYYNILYMCRVMLYFNSAINPILYNVMSSKFREAFFRVLGCPLGSSSRRSRWLCRHLSRQSTFTTSSTLPTSSVKSTYGKHNGDSVRVRQMSEKNGMMIFAGGGGSGTRHPAALRAASGPYYPPKRQMSTDGTLPPTAHIIQHTNNKKSMIRANSVV